MKTDILLGLQWGDEGKGKIVDVLAPDYEVITRFQGGPNAGHSLEFKGKKFILHTIPSGVFRKDKLNIIGNGVVIDPVIFAEEIQSLKNEGIELNKENLLISTKAHLILPTHRLLDAASEAFKGGSKIGSTLKGIGPTYMDKTGRNGLRLGDIIRPGFMGKYKALTLKHKDLLNMYHYKGEQDDYEKKWFDGIEVIRSFDLVESEYRINRLLDDGRNILAEGAQGTLLDIDFGTYPYVTSSNTITAGALTGLGLAPSRIGHVKGIFKAYCTRVGSGPFPTELHNEKGEFLRQKGHEYGATTGRPRRCGWLDLPALRYAIMLNGVTELIMTKPDVLSGLESFMICTHYQIDGKNTNQLPYSLEDNIKPVYKSFKGWSQDISGIRMYRDLPEELKAYKNFIEKETGIPITIISVGPDREAVVMIEK
ncbi:MAG TPA: adenylosuccinate synthase [Bacteroidetes bacterium]|nr:adenylosuccinate synthase [Bacteroidota bacterium]